MAWLLIPAALLLAALGITRFAWRAAFLSTAAQRRRYTRLPDKGQYRKYRETMLSLIESFEELPYESVEIPAYDGVRLFGRYYHLRDGAPLQIEMHGYRGSATRDFCGGNALARSLGMNTLVVDQRGHGRSGGHVISFGVRERRDCQSWAQYAYLRFGAQTPIYLAGVSMGAATVLMASELELPHTVRGIIADCPYSSPEAIIRKVAAENAHLPAAPLMPFVRFAARAFGHFALGESSAVGAVANTDIPILLIHGEADSFVPCDMSREIAAACRGSCTLLTVPGAEHAVSCLAAPEQYRRAVEDFIGQ